MKIKAIALLSGGLDSTLAIHIVKEQGVEIEALNFQTMFTCCRDDARRVAYELGVKYVSFQVGNDYLDLVKNPKFGRGRGMNPCVDCRIYMFHAAGRYLRETGASFLISGEVLGQRPMSQKMRDFRNIEADTGLERLILRPLSAKRLPITIPEEMGWVDRQKLFGFEGRSRKRLIEIAKGYGMTDIPHPSSGCSLTDVRFSKKVKDVFDHQPQYQRWEFELLKIGRHFRLSPEVKMVMARNGDQNEYLQGLHPAGTTLVKPANFAGPSALAMGPCDPEYLEKISALILSYSRKPLPDECILSWSRDGEERLFRATGEATQELLEGLRIA